uniref:Uncharacterized protein n=1 Tax=Thermosporothrix sp. COM3 TaxID=2490863 RepID=A0A455SX26_9CHLR|nr:hypothetical protein KTC_64820 [Thermosporothrix sp. COM3]
MVTRVRCVEELFLQSGRDGRRRDESGEEMSEVTSSEVVWLHARIA